MNDSSRTYNDKAWEKLFAKYNILKSIEKSGQYVISASQIKEYREPRLMTKLDHKANLPYVFKEHQLAILPISRGDYIISNFEAYKEFDFAHAEVNRASLPDGIQSLNPDNIFSESMAINCAVASGMLHNFLEEERLYATVSGRMGSGRFDFDIQNAKTGSTSNVRVNNSQIEIDAAYEGIESLALIEAKHDLSDDFITRQLYYPYRVWQNRVTKTVRPVFMVYSNGIFSLYEYTFQVPELYNSLVLVKHRNYTVEDTEITMSDLLDIVAQVNTFIPEPPLPFPQADSFERIINLCELLESRELCRDEVTTKYDFDARQTNYYTDAARYLGLVDKRTEDGRIFFCLNQAGRKIMRLRFRNRQLALCKCILQHKVFYNVFVLCQGGSIPDKRRIVQEMKQSNLYQVGSDSTYERRASTIIGWMKWMFDLL